MVKRFLALCTAVMLCLAAGTAMADSIRERLGVTGRIGFLVPSDSELSGLVVGTDTGFIGGGGLIYGVNDNIAAELDITHAAFDADAGLDFDLTNITFGVQYRFLNGPIRRLVPYAGGGLDILLNDVRGGSVDNTVGVHLSAGFDYFVQRQLAVTGEIKGILAPDADMRVRGVAGDFDPTNFSMTFGARYFFN